MTLEDIIESVNQYIEDRRKKINADNRQHLVLQRTITPDPVFKVYKQYQFILWVVDYSSQNRLLTLSHKANVPANLEESLIHDLEKQFILGLLANLIDGKSYISKDRTLLEDIIYGEYTGYCNE